MKVCHQRASFMRIAISAACGERFCTSLLNRSGPATALGAARCADQRERGPAAKSHKICCRWRKPPESNGELGLVPKSETDKKLLDNLVETGYAKPEPEISDDPAIPVKYRLTVLGQKWVNARKRPSGT